MPLYDYECPECGERFEEFRSIAERATAPCPQCARPAQKQLSSFFTTRGSSSPAADCGFERGGGGCGAGVPGGG